MTDFMTLLGVVSPVALLASLLLGALAIGKVKASEAWKDVAMARKEEIDVRDNKIGALEEKVDFLQETAKVNVSELEKLRGMPNLATLLDALKELRASDDIRYQTLAARIDSNHKSISEDIDRRFAAFAESLHEYHKAEIGLLNEIREKPNA